MDYKTRGDIYQHAIREQPNDPIKVHTLKFQFSGISDSLFHTIIQDGSYKSPSHQKINEAINST